MIEVIYHGNCFDGMAAAWAAWKKLGNEGVKYTPAYYGDSKLTNRLTQDCYENANINDTLYILDFSFKRPLMDLLASKLKKLLVLDHHKTAEKELEGAGYAIFDMEKSGARLAWEYFHWMKDSGGMFYGEDEFNPEVPDLIKYVEDRDLWRFKLPNSEAVNSYIQAAPMNIASYDVIARALEIDLDSCIEIGQGIEQYKKLMTQIIGDRAELLNLIGYTIPVVNTTLLFSEVGHYLCQKYPNSPFAIGWYDRDRYTRCFSLRSIGDFDVSQVAKSFGGGGHKNAAGFEINITDFRLI